MYLREGLSQAEIGERLRMTQQMVSYDLCALQREWLKAGLMDLTEAKARELAKIDGLELEYWTAWEKSKEVKEIDTSGKMYGGDVRAQVRKETRDGNPAFLTGVQWCIDRRAKLLGLDAPTKIAPTDPTGEKPYDNVSDDERIARLATLLDAARTRRDGQPAGNLPAAL
jgi:transcriptional regulator with XRE-family HTH domain